MKPDLDSLVQAHAKQLNQRITRSTMKIEFTFCLMQTLDSRQYLLIAIPDQKIGQLEWREEYAQAMSYLIGVPVVLVGRLVGQVWQVYGEVGLIHHAKQQDFALLPWQDFQGELAA
jgi:hypothetical protein